MYNTAIDYIIRLFYEYVHLNVSPPCTEHKVYKLTLLYLNNKQTKKGGMEKRKLCINYHFFLLWFELIILL